MIVSINGRLGARCVGLGWQTADARFHVWVDQATLKPGQTDYNGRRFTTAYKNSLTPRGQPARFETRYLRLDSKPIAKAFAEAQRIARENHLVEAFLAAEHAEAERKAEAAQDAIRLERIKDAGPALLEALKDIIHELEASAYYATRPTVQDKAEAARAAIASAEGAAS